MVKFATGTPAAINPRTSPAMSKIAEPFRPAAIGLAVRSGRSPTFSNNAPTSIAISNLPKGCH